MSSDGRQTDPIAARGLVMVPRSHCGRKNIPVHAKNPPSPGRVSHATYCVMMMKRVFYSFIAGASGIPGCCSLPETSAHP